MVENNKLRQERHALLRRLTRILEVPMTLLGFVWLVLLIVELTRGLPPWLEQMATIIWILFIVDFGIKVVIAPDKRRFITKNWLTVLSLLVPALRVFRALRFVRLLRGLRGVRLVRIVGTLNRGMRSLSATMRRRGFVYVLLLTLVVLFAGAAGMFAFEKNGGISSYSHALWWTAMMLITSGSEYWPVSTEGRALGFLIALYGFSIFGYITATLASFFVGSDAAHQEAAANNSSALESLKEEIAQLKEVIGLLANKKSEDAPPPANH